MSRRRGCLLKDGICIHEYKERPLHAKIAIVDHQWSTVGSSNLDPLSLSLNLEANLFIRDAGLNREIPAHLTELIESSYQMVTPSTMWPPVGYSPP
ncbi:phospholipase D-like domain-containing protein [Halomonas sp. PA5]|uniref:phospholipase D-like domain-containing protein n=1 Tax=Halomonadaceae TaxID=28256 RepID=UPI00349FADF9